MSISKETNYSQVSHNVQINFVTCAINDCYEIVQIPGFFSMITMLLDNDREILMN